MEKIQMDAILAVQTVPQTSRYQTTDLTKTDFSKLLKGQNQAVSQTTDAKTPEKPSQKTDGEVKDPTAKEPTDTKADESEETKDGETVPAELLLQLQGAAGLLVAELPVETESVDAESVGVELPETAGPDAVAETVPELTPQETDMAQELVPAVTETAADAMPEESVPTAATVESEFQEAQTAPQKQPVQEAQAEPMKADSQKEAQKETKVSEPSQTVLGSQTEEQAVAPVKAQAESQTENKAKEEAQPEQTFSGMEHLQIRNHSLEAMKAEDAGTATVRTTENTLIEDVGRTLAERFPQKDGMLTIELEPASLGKLTIQVLYEGGRAMVSILATNPKTLELLSQKASELGTILEEHTGQETVVYTEQPEAEQPYDERQREEQRREPESDGQEQQNDRASQESFAQQLRLGLV